ncbi:hypothetical protein K439DRAFT_339251 [Ramaria rubella]|nr:hypothetical protein K439DRAFT_339251 [Ramaria rubella]
MDSCTWCRLYCHKHHLMTVFHRMRTRHHCRVDSGCQQLVSLIYAMDFCPWLCPDGYDHRCYPAFPPMTV